MKLDLGLLVLRLGMGGTMFLAHGWGKLMGFSEMSAHFPDPIGLGSTVSLFLAVFAEAFCALAVAIGAGARWAALPVMITMAVAFFLIHGGDPWAKKELAFMYLVGFSTIFFTGPGGFSVDRLIQKNRRP